MGLLMLGTLALILTGALAYLGFGLYATWAWLAEVDAAHRGAPFWLALPLVLGILGLGAWAWRSYGERGWSRSTRRSLDAAGTEDPDQWTSLGRAYLEGQKGLPRDEAAARHWLTRAAEAGSRDAMLLLAGLMEQGRGGLRDLDGAHAWRERAR
jgi:TPR repeat protein